MMKPSTPLLALTLSAVISLSSPLAYAKKPAKAPVAQNNLYDLQRDAKSIVRIECTENRVDREAGEYDLNLKLIIHFAKIKPYLSTNKASFDEEFNRIPSSPSESYHQRIRNDIYLPADKKVGRVFKLEVIDNAVPAQLKTDYTASGINISGAEIAILAVAHDNSRGYRRGALMKMTVSNSNESAKLDIKSYYVNGSTSRSNYHLDCKRV